MWPRVCGAVPPIRDLCQEERKGSIPAQITRQNREMLRYDRYLVEGFPIATGGSLRGPAVTSSKTAWTSLGHAGDYAAPRRSGRFTPAAIPRPTGRFTRPKSIRAAFFHGWRATTFERPPDLPARRFKRAAPIGILNALFRRLVPYCWASELSNGSSALESGTLRAVHRPDAPCGGAFWASMGQRGLPAQGCSGI
jgi:hypothetical protein